MRVIHNRRNTIDERNLLKHLKEQGFDDIDLIEKQIFGEKQKPDLFFQPRISGKQVPRISNRGNHSPSRR